jgi:hypothetical protein
VNLLAAELAFAQGNVAEVTKRLSAQAGWDILRDAANLRAAETLAEALIKRDEPVAAVKGLEQALTSGYFGSMDSAYWKMRCQLRLAELYQRLGRHEDATKLASALSAQLEQAEPGFPMLTRVEAVLRDRRR